MAKAKSSKPQSLREMNGPTLLLDNGFDSNLLKIPCPTKEEVAKRANNFEATLIINSDLQPDSSGEKNSLDFIKTT